MQRTGRKPRRFSRSLKRSNEKKKKNHSPIGNHSNGTSSCRCSSWRTHLWNYRSFWIMSRSWDRQRMMKCPAFWVGQEVILNDEINEAQAQGYGLECEDPRVALEPDTLYEVVGIDVRRFATGIYLQGVDGRFNSVCFHASP